MRRRGAFCMLRRRAGDSQPQAKAGSCAKRRRLDGAPGGKSSADFRFAVGSGDAAAFQELAASGRDALFAARALSLMGRYGRLHCLSSGFFCEAPKVRDAGALEEAVRGGAGGEGERLSLLPLFVDWLCCDGIRALWRGDTGSAGANAAIGFEKRRRGRRDVGRGIFQTRIRPERAFTREGLPLMRPRLYPRGGKLPDVLWSGKGKARFKHGYAQPIGQKSSKNRNLFDYFKKTNYKNSAKKMVK